MIRKKSWAGFRQTVSIPKFQKCTPRNSFWTLISNSIPQQHGWNRISLLLKKSKHRACLWACVVAVRPAMCVSSWAFSGQALTGHLARKPYPTGKTFKTWHFHLFLSLSFPCVLPPRHPVSFPLPLFNLAVHLWTQSPGDLPCEINSHSILGILPSWVYPPWKKKKKW